MSVISQSLSIGLGDINCPPPIYKKKKIIKKKIIIIILEILAYFSDPTKLWVSYHCWWEKCEKSHHKP